jgi:hypothetical protein
MYTDKRRAESKEEAAGLTGTIAQSCAQLFLWLEVGRLDFWERRKSIE